MFCYSRKILVVDDEQLVRWSVRRYLEAEGFEAFEADGGSRALEIMETEAIDILITDLMMPEMDGVELIRKAVARNPDLIVLVITADDSSDKVLAAEEAGAMKTFTKPIPFRELTGTIHGLV
ncbi:MAG TPA: response regulator [Proteobacteria bacterium]|nr:response regulator MprA [bacterium BMS3Abin14]HDL53435.1 response regulator [Pseudomonadota bacterium]